MLNAGVGIRGKDCDTARQSLCGETRLVDFIIRYSCNRRGVIQYQACAFRNLYYYYFQPTKSLPTGLGPGASNLQADASVNSPQAGNPPHQDRVSAAVLGIRVAFI